MCRRPRIGSAPFVSVFLMLTVIAVMPVNSPSGVPVGIARHVICGTSDEGSIVLAVRFDGSVTTINTEPLALINLEKRLTEIFSTRPGRTLLLYADPDVPFALVAGIIAGASKIVPVALLTNKVIGQEPSCAPRKIVCPPKPARTTCHCEM